MRAEAQEQKTLPYATPYQCVEHVPGLGVLEWRAGEAFVEKTFKKWWEEECLDTVDKLQFTQACCEVLQKDQKEWRESREKYSKTVASWIGFPSPSFACYYGVFFLRLLFLEDDQEQRLRDRFPKNRYSPSTSIALGLKWLKRFKGLDEPSRLRLLELITDVNGNNVLHIALKYSLLPYALLSLEEPTPAMRWINALAQQKNIREETPLALIYDIQGLSCDAHGVFSVDLLQHPLLSWITPEVRATAPMISLDVFLRERLFQVEQNPIIQLLKNIYRLRKYIKFIPVIVSKEEGQTSACQSQMQRLEAYLCTLLQAVSKGGPLLTPLLQYLFTTSTYIRLLKSTYEDIYCRAMFADGKRQGRKWMEEDQDREYDELTHHGKPLIHVGCHLQATTQRLLKIAIGAGADINFEAIWCRFENICIAWSSRSYQDEDVEWTCGGTSRLVMSFTPAAPLRFNQIKIRCTFLQWLPDIVLYKFRAQLIKNHLLENRSPKEIRRLLSDPTAPLSHYLPLAVWDELQSRRLTLFFIYEYFVRRAGEGVDKDFLDRLQHFQCLYHALTTKQEHRLTPSSSGELPTAAVNPLLFDVRLFRGVRSNNYGLLVTRLREHYNESIFTNPMQWQISVDSFASFLTQRRDSALSHPETRAESRSAPSADASEALKARIAADILNSSPAEEPSGNREDGSPQHGVVEHPFSSPTEEGVEMAYRGLS